MKWLLTFLLVMVLAWFGFKELVNSESYQWSGEIVDRVETDEPVVALTFDDGPMPGKTAEILAILEEQGVRATFFLVGAAMEEHPAQARMIVEAGHEVGNHSYTHSRMVFKSFNFVADELERTDLAIRAAGYVEPIHFRPPFGKKLFNLPRYLSANDITTIMWDVAPETFREGDDGRDVVLRRVLEQARPGSIILLHVMFDSRKDTMAAVPGIIEGLRARGFGFVTVSELIESGKDGAGSL